METLLSERFLPAPGQGILAIECRENDEEVLAILETIHSKEGAEMLFAERAYLQTLNGGCNAPAGAYCRRENGKLVMEAMYAKDGIHTKYAKQQLEVKPFDSEGDVDNKKSHTDSFAKQLGKNLAEQVNIGKVYLVGAGAGDEGLLTVKARELLQKADVIVYDSLISTSILQETKVDSEWIYAGKRSNNHHLPQEETNQILWKKAKEGKMVVRLKGGDPFIFGRGAEEALELLEHGVDFEIVPGVSSCYSVPAYAGVPVMLNPAPAAHLSEHLLSCITYLSPNEHEASLLAGRRLQTEPELNRSDVQDICQVFLSKGIKNLIITLGEHGAVTADRGNILYTDCIRMPEVRDPTAAGDSFVAAFCTGICAGLSAKEALTFASYTAAITVSRMGAMPSLPTVSEVQALMQERSCNVLDLNRLNDLK